MVAALIAETAAVRVERAGCGPGVWRSALRRLHVARYFTCDRVFAAPCVLIVVVALRSSRLGRVVAV